MSPLRTTSGGSSSSSRLMIVPETGDVVSSSKLNFRMAFFSGDFQGDGFFADVLFGVLDVFGSSSKLLFLDGGDEGVGVAGGVIGAFDFKERSKGDGMYGSG